MDMMGATVMAGLGPATHAFLPFDRMALMAQDNPRHDGRGDQIHDTMGTSA
jgi:hypothetical protein